MTRRRWVTAVLVVSLTGNLLALGTAAAYVADNGGVDYVGRKLGISSVPRPDFPALGRARFGPLPVADGDVAFVGDSEVQNAPLADLLTPYKQRGIGGQSVSDVAAWVNEVLATPIKRVVLLAGTNNVLAAQPAPAFASDYAGLLDTISGRRPDVVIVVMSIPPQRGGQAATVPAFNAELRRLTVERRLQYVDLFALLADEDNLLDQRWAADDVHLNPAGYARAAEAFRSAAGHVTG